MTAHDVETERSRAVIDRPYNQRSTLFSSDDGISLERSGFLKVIGCGLRLARWRFVSPRSGGVTSSGHGPRLQSDVQGCLRFLDLPGIATGVPAPRMARRSRDTPEPSLSDNHYRYEELGKRRGEGPWVDIET